LRPTAALAAVFVLVFFSASFGATAGQGLSQGKVLHIDARGLDLLLQSDPNLLLVDVRTPGELTGPLGKIPQARNVPMQELEKSPERLPRDKTLVVICRSGHRSLRVADLLAEHGYVVYSVDGGMRSWRKLHPLAAPAAEGAVPKEPGAQVHTPDTGTSLPPKDENQHRPEQFFDSDMGC
jgi:rhodanese-related sulfurtransferase